MSVGKTDIPSSFCSVVAIFTPPKPSSFPSLLPSAKFSHHVPSQFPSQFPAHMVVQEYVLNSQGWKQALQIHTRFVTQWATACRLGFELG